MRRLPADERVRLTGSCWPTSDQALLLQAALLEGGAARTALDAWCSRTAADRLDRASTRLLPLLCQRLVQDDPDHPLLPRLQGEFERTVSRNRAVAEATKDGVNALSTAGIESCLLKGMALIARGYMPLGTRSMADGDVLVPAAQALAARQTLVAAGWKLEGRLDADLLPVRHAVPFRNPAGQQLDLHWHVLAECCTASADDRFWRSSEPVAHPPARTLCGADMLLHACVHGLSWSIVPTVRWVVDAALVIRGAGPAMDWDRLTDQAERHLLALPLIDALTYLRHTIELPIPEWVPARLAEINTPRWTAAEYDAKMRRRSLHRQILIHWFRHRRLSGSGSVLGDLVRVPAYMRRRWRARPIVSAAVPRHRT